MVEGFARAAVYSSAYFYLRHRLTDPALSANGTTSIFGSSGVVGDSGSGSGSHHQSLSVRDAAAVGGVTAMLAAVVSYPMQVRGLNAMQANDACFTARTRRKYHVFSTVLNRRNSLHPVDPLASFDFSYYICI